MDELPGNVYVSAFLYSFAPPFFSVLFSSFLGFFVWVAFSRVLFPFLPWHRLLNPFPFFFLQLFIRIMVRLKPSSSSPPKTDYKALYTWAPDDLLNECTTLTTFQDLENHRGDPHLYNFNAFCRTHDAHISVRPGRPGEPVCVDDRPMRGNPFFFMYQNVFKRVGVRLPLTPFERELLTEINTAPAQLHPNS